MAEPLKHFFSPSLVRSIGAAVAAVHTTFDLRGFERSATRGLGSLELLDRGRHIMEALRAHLPPAYEDALAILVRSLGPASSADENLGGGMAPFFYLPHVEFIRAHGVHDFERSMAAQEELARRPLEHGAPKRGDARALALLGFGGRTKVDLADVVFAPTKVAIGQTTVVSFTLTNRARHVASLLVDLAVHFQKARGTSAKVFKCKRVELGPGASTSFSKSVSLAVHTTRKPQLGPHRVDVLINGVAHPVGQFEVVASGGPLVRNRGAGHWCGTVMHAACQRLTSRTARSIVLWISVHDTDHAMRGIGVLSASSKYASATST